MAYLPKVILMIKFTNWTLNGEEIIPNEKDIAYRKDRDSY